MALKCWECDSDSHVAAECPNRATLGSDGKPPWCGFCDEQTRLLDAGDVVTRCQTCHPLRRQMLKQHRRCPRCHMTVYQWDNNECGNHSSPAAIDRRPEREHLARIVAANSGSGE